MGITFYIPCVCPLSRGNIDRDEIITQVEKTASQIAAGDLDKRVPDWPLHTEVGQLSAAMDEAAARIRQHLGTDEEGRR